MTNAFDPMVPATLSTLCNGELENLFQSNVPSLLSQLGHGQKATLSLNLEFTRVPNTDTMINIKATAKPTYPSRVKVAVGQITGDCKLQVDKPSEKVVQMSLVSESKFVANV